MAEKKRILLLDDSTITLEMEKAVLEDRGYKVAIASNLLEFQKELDAFQPEIILTDLMMPDISGKDIVRVLKQDFHTEKIPIILFSSKGDEELAAIAEQAGADGFLSKSHGIEKLGDMVDEMVDSILW
ncbi:MAG TPA: response regulator [Anaeromyxobacter sp.]|nr:response regulator [Anaeromyxobacter sp.]